ncbi:type IX secretion system membrane protein PorP/SprF [Taibaiella lutea]|uniref:Type IX secretion system membrane protein PorP/SprF n=1 Tax=Taibaiella lutea TaxID=2608001 RepID=A0A5M6CE57_9BACT|nr:PorP/SprF family type IX secretion system membrane protein [Taibaiella lutea]KAA5533263.1 type IX secretion system membrane protein PorP/SprF [Taibaiella lutea]
MKKILLSALAMAGISLGTSAQDVHFTQYFTSPLTLNPAQTGLTQNDWRASANFRTQWYTVSDNPYVSGTISFDMPLLRGKLPEGDALGIGVLGLYDKSGTGGLQNTTLGISLAYHKSFGMDKQHTVSLGVQGFMVQKSIQFDKLIFGDQFDATMPEGYLKGSSAEQFGNADLTYPDFNVGLMYSGRVAENATMYGGVAFYHLTRPEEKFLNSAGSTGVKINSRLSAHLGGSFDLNENTVMYLSAMYQKQGPASEFLMGGAVGFVMNPGHDEFTRNTVFYLGGWYRYGDAIAPYVGFEWSRMKIGFSYDVTMSSAQNMTSGQGAYEVSLIYNGVINKITHKKYNFACPKF